MKRCKNRLQAHSCLVVFVNCRGICAEGYSLQISFLQQMVSFQLLKGRKSIKVTKWRCMPHAEGDWPFRYSSTVRGPRPSRGSNERLLVPLLQASLNSRPRSGSGPCDSPIQTPLHKSLKYLTGWALQCQLVPIWCACHFDSLSCGWSGLLRWSALQNLLTALPSDNQQTTRG